MADTDQTPPAEDTAKVTSTPSPTAEVATPPAEVVPEQEPVLVLSDIGAVVNIIDDCSRRGAFRGQELSTVGGIRDRLAAFYAFNAKKLPTPTAKQE